ncbi:MAG: hypothetical protein AMJ79_15740 [Phycisphaerae bacterium SM23_30]|nr:MAG: hypothetical protein AMJ79_15740 [Phycisphaerae bacterium SM23_30]
MADATLKNHLKIGAVEQPHFANYEIIRRLGFGAGSVIYSVKNKKSGQICALKHVIRKEGENGRMIEQVENEYHIGTKIDHPYVRKTLEIHRRRHHWRTREVIMLMEYCPGVSLEQSPSRSLLDLLLIFRMVADGIGGMHNQGYLHCDMKPNNIIIADNGLIRIIDFGQSCRNGTIKPRIQGTPDYIAPEQVKRKPLSTRTDVFNLGATMYWALTGKHVPTLIPKKHADRLNLSVPSDSEAPVAPHQLKPKIPVGVSNLVMECVKNDPRERPADMPTLISRFDLLIHLITDGKPIAANGVNGVNGANGINGPRKYH